ncbi:MAG TPA: ABC transporter ATP-binding protein [Hyphomonadaceae bacterium]|nr:ABC transporter ATP-binding protein [Hyphomonadaceae bacterium]
MIIATEKLAKTYGSREAVHGVDLEVPQGAAMALIGANGAGKTTTIRMLMNILRPDAGSARVLGVESRKLSAAEFQRIGYVSENQRMPERLSVAGFFDYLRPLYPTWDRKLEDSLRASLDLPGDRRIGQLSHGMRMKVALASALPFHPELLVLDEPLSGVDALVRDEFMAGMLAQAGEMTVLISSHDLADIEGSASHVAFMDRGRLLFQESMDQLTGRFRAVSVTMSNELSPPRDDASWLEAKASGHVFSFVESRFEGEEQLRRKIAGKLGEARNVDVRPMSLRAISTALMRNARRDASTQ